MRTLLGLFLIVGLAVAQAAPEQLRHLFGDKWGRMPEWRQHEIVRMWQRFEHMPPARQREIKRTGLKEFLVRPVKRFELPDALRKELAQLPDGVRGVVTKLAVMRLRTMRLDRNLFLVPQEQRRPLFDRLFPKHFEREKARQAWKELGRQVSRAIARDVLTRVKDKEAMTGRALSRNEKAQLVRTISSREEEKILGRVRKEIRRFRSLRPEQIRRVLEKEGYHLLERHPLMRSPRQKELIRYAFRPERCPLIDLGFMGPRPTEPAARRLWDRDFLVLARIELLSGDFPPEMVLHLAAASSPADFFRAVQAYSLRRDSRRKG